ncbi:MAG: carotenoid oxygenase family protein, partial [Actinobacteria bacterium]|nr:carotenoid oxygenase family protein [Actinomycetota bacterium]
AGTGGAAALLSGCSGGGAGGAGSAGRRSPAGAAASAATIGGRPAAAVQAFDPGQPFWLQGNFRPVATETTATGLEVEGSLPPELTGLYVRNGSNSASVPGAHWFFGDGMLHGIRLARGKAVWYRNRWVRTPLYEERRNFRGIPGKTENQSNVSVVAHAGALLSLGEVGWPFRIDPSDLSTAGAQSYGGRLGTAMTAHPKIDPTNGHMHAFGYDLLRPELSYYHVDDRGRLLANQVIPLPEVRMVHDFAITERDVVFWTGPVLFGPGKAAPKVPFHWDGTLPARIGVMPLGGPASAIRWVDFDPCYAYHGLNAWRDGNEVVLVVDRLPSSFASADEIGPPGAIHEWRVDTSGAQLRFSDRKLSDTQMDLPAHDRRRTGRPVRHGWWASTRRGGTYGFEFSGLVHQDLRTGKEVRWDPGLMEVPGEAFYVPASDRAPEGEGWLLTLCYDRTRDRSHLAVLDAADVAKGPVARVRLPVRVPYGFHGWWLPDA